jgi:hypothetical protein
MPLGRSSIRERRLKQTACVSSISSLAELFYPEEELEGAAEVPLFGGMRAAYQTMPRIARSTLQEYAAPVRDTSGICSRRRGVICPSGGLLKGVSTPFCKNISLHPSGKSSLQILAIPPHKRGVGHRHERGEGCGGRGSVLRATGLQGRLKNL